MSPTVADQAREAFHQGDYPKAERLLRQWRERDPQNPICRLDLATLLITLVRHQEAAAELAAAETHAGRSPDILRQVAAGYFSMYRSDEAKRLLEPSARAGHLPSLLGWLQILEREGSLDEAAGLIDEALARHPGHAELLLLRGQILVRQGRLEAAESDARALLAAHPPFLLLLRAGYLLANVLDRTGRHAAAAAAIAPIKKSLASHPAAARLQKEFRSRLALARELVDTCSRGVPDAWTADAASCPLDFHPVLLCGHPRSGTTVLEARLERLNGVLSFDESAAFDGGALTSAGVVGRVNILRTLRPNGRDLALSARRHYARSLAELHQSPFQSTPHVIDKNPTQIVQLPLWLRIVPEIRLLIALRDPRDVVVSSYFFDLPPNATSLQFLDWESTARHYAALMDLWRRWRDVVPAASWIESRYEDMVADTPGETARIARFLGLAGAEKPDAQASAVVHSPNYATAAKPVHARSVGRWSHYESFLAPAQATLAPFLKAFGYS